MTTIIVNINNDIVNTEQIVSAISIFKGINKIEVKNDAPKSKTQLLIEKMEAGEYVSDDEYLASIPGFLEEIDKEANDPNTEWFPLSEVLPDV